MTLDFSWLFAKLIGARSTRTGQLSRPRTQHQQPAAYHTIRNQVLGNKELILGWAPTSRGGQLGCPDGPGVIFGVPLSNYPPLGLNASQRLVVMVQARARGPTSGLPALCVAADVSSTSGPRLGKYLHRV